MASGFIIGDVYYCGERAIMNLFIKERNDWSEKDICDIDAFILAPSTNGEFINSLRFLSYHPKNRFQDASIAIFDRDCGRLCGVVLANEIRCSKETCLVSHQGTTFAGPVLSQRLGIRETKAVLECIISYYEARYSKIEFRLAPEIYGTQPFGRIEYFLLCHGYQYGLSGLANVISLSGITDENTSLLLYKAKRRNQVRKALREHKYHIQHFEIVPEYAWHSLEENLWDKYGVKPTHTLSEINDLLLRFPQNISVDVALRSDGCYGALAVSFLFRRVWHTQYLDLNYALAKDYPNLFLIHELIGEAIQQGYPWFSFGVSNERNVKVLNEGLFDYKSNFGGGEVLLPCFVKKRCDGHFAN